MTLFDRDIQFVDHIGKEEPTDFDDPKEVDKVFDEMSEVEKDLCKLKDKMERSIYRIAYSQCIIDAHRIVGEYDTAIANKTSSELLKIHLKAKERNYCD